MIFRLQFNYVKKSINEPTSFKKYMCKWLLFNTNKVVHNRKICNRTIRNSIKNTHTFDSRFGSSSVQSNKKKRKYRLQIANKTIIFAICVII